MKKLLTVTLALLAAASLQADTVEYTDSIVMNSSQDAVISLSEFDVALGTLTGVYIEYWTTLSGALFQMDNDSALAQTGTAKLRHIGLTFSSDKSNTDTGGGSAVDSTDLRISQEQLFSLTATTGDNTTIFNDTGLGDFASWAPGTLTSLGSGDIHSFFINDYEGTGTYDVTANAEINTFVEFSGNDGRIAIDTPSGAFSGKVIYTYTPIPEPATASMMALAGLMALLARRHFID